MRRVGNALRRLHFRAHEPVAAWLADAPPPPRSATARAVYCLDQRSRTPLLSRNADYRLVPASTVKLATALVLVQRQPSLDDTVTIEPCDCIRGSTMGLLPGDVVSYHDLLIGLLIASGNDAAQAIARNVGSVGGRVSGSDGVARFVGWMNELGASLGLRRTRFVNASGWPVSGQLSTARDLAHLGAAAFANDLIVDACGRAGHAVSVGGPQARELALTSTLELLSRPEVVAGKTGTAPSAGSNLVLYAHLEGRDVVTALLGCAARFRSARLVPGTDRRFADAQCVLDALRAGHREP